MEHTQIASCTTSSGTKLVVKRGTGLFHDNDFSDPQVSKVEIHFCGESGIAFLVGPRNVPFSLSSNGPRSFVHVVKIQESDEGTFSILDLWSRQYLSARDADGLRGHMQTRTLVNEWECFKTSEPRVKVKVSDLAINLIHKRAVTAEDIALLISQSEESAYWVISALLPSSASKNLVFWAKKSFYPGILSKNFRAYFQGTYGYRGRFHFCLSK